MISHLRCLFLFRQTVLLSLLMQIIWFLMKTAVWFAQQTPTPTHRNKHYLDFKDLFSGFETSAVLFRVLGGHVKSMEYVYIFIWLVFFVRVWLNFCVSLIWEKLTTQICLYFSWIFEKLKAKISKKDWRTDKKELVDKGVELLNWDFETRLSVYISHAVEGLLGQLPL